MNIGKIFFAVLLGTILIPQSGLAQQSSDSMVVVLSNLGVLRGQVTTTDDGVNVRTDSGSLAILRPDQVACLAESLDDAYQQLLAATDANDVRKLERLFDWCLRNGLGDRAAELLTLLKSRQVPASELQRMQRRLDHFAIAARRALNQSWPSEIESVREKPLGNLQEIETAIKSLPDQAEAFFNQQIHAKLVLGCTAAKCHARDSLAMPIWHLGKGIANPRGLTRRNLFEVLQHVDRENPAASKILEMAITPHGGQTKPTFDKEDTAYRLLQNWTYAVSQHPENYWTEVVQNAGRPATAKPAEVENPAPQENLVTQVGFEELDSTPVAPPQMDGNPAGPPLVAPVDPCDPLLFNRQFHPDRDR